MANRSMLAKVARSRKQGMELMLQESNKTCYMGGDKVRAEALALIATADESLKAWKSAEVERRNQRVRLRSHF